MHRAKLLAWIGVGWHGIEAAIAIAAGLAVDLDECDDGCCSPAAP